MLLIHHDPNLRGQIIDLPLSRRRTVVRSRQAPRAEIPSEMRCRIRVDLRHIETPTRKVKHIYIKKIL